MPQHPPPPPVAEPIGQTFDFTVEVNGVLESMSQIGENAALATALLVRRLRAERGWQAVVTIVACEARPARV
jgi:hypothetical protein